MRIISTVLFASLFVLGLTACDGGGGGSDDDAPPAPAPVPLEPVVINQDNAEEVVTAVMAVVGIVGDLGAGGVLPMQDTGVKTPGLTTSEADLPQVDLFDLLANTQSGIQVAVAEALKVPCLVSGSIDVAAQIADPSGELLTPGDSISTTFLSCDNGDGALLNGKMGMVVVVPVDTAFTAPYDYTFDITLADFSLTEAGETTVADGDLSTREATPDGVFFETELAGHKLSIESGGIREVLMEFRVYGTYNAADGKYTVDAGGFSGCCATLASELFGGAVEYENTFPFEGVGDDFPYAGALMITGAVAEGGVGPSAVEVAALDAVYAEIWLDENGDEVFAGPKMVTWESITSGSSDDANPVW